MSRTSSKTVYVLGGFEFMVTPRQREFLDILVGSGDIPVGISELCSRMGVSLNNLRVLKLGLSCLLRESGYYILNTRGGYKLVKGD